MNYLDLPILWNLSPYALIPTPVFIPSYFSYYALYYNEIWHDYYSATIDKLLQKIKHKYDFIPDAITLECQGKIGAD